MQQPSTYQGRAKYVGPSLLLHWIFHSKKEVSSIDQITFWLTCLLHLLLIVHQARILNIYYIANGPHPSSTFSSSSLLFRPSNSKSSFTKSYLPVFVLLLPWQIEVKDYPVMGNCVRKPVKCAHASSSNFPPSG
jgi:hypothetical protein